MAKFYFGKKNSLMLIKSLLQILQIINGKLVMDFTYLDLKEVVLWVGHSLTLIKIKKEQYLLVLQIKDNCLYVIGRLEVLIKQEAKMILSFNIGINKETSDLLWLWIYHHRTKILF